MTLTIVLLVTVLLLALALALAVAVAHGRRAHIAARERRRVVVHTRDRVSIRGWQSASAPRTGPTAPVVLHDAEYLEHDPPHGVGTIEVPASNVGWIQRLEAGS